MGVGGCTRVDLRFQLLTWQTPPHCRASLTSAGCAALLDNFPPADAPAVARLQQRGALVLAKTSMGEMVGGWVGGWVSEVQRLAGRQLGAAGRPTMCWAACHLSPHSEASVLLLPSLPPAQAFFPAFCLSSVSGVVRNPFRLSHTPGGSSGGSAAAAAASLGMAALGTDTGNSVRGPASHAALVGLRPSLGLVSRAGLVPLRADRDAAGPMARTVGAVGGRAVEWEGGWVSCAQQQQVERLGLAANHTCAACLLQPHAAATVCAEDAVRLFEAMVGPDREDPLAQPLLNVGV